MKNVRLRIGHVLLAACAMAGANPSAWAQTCAAGETAVPFAFTGGPQTTTVPAGVQSLTVYLSGAQGGAGRSGAGSIGGSPNSPGGTGGLGGRVRGTLAVTPGTQLTVLVGGQGSQAVNPGGIGQGVDGIGGGGTDLRVGGNAVGNRVAIAGGGGGGGNAGWSTANVIAGGAGGVGGGGSGVAGATVPGGPGPFGGGGGALGTGGAGGAGCGSFPATAGNAGNGDGGDSFNFSGSFAGAGFGGGGGGGAQVGAGGGGAGVGTTGCQQNWNGGGGGGAGGSSGATGLTAVTINNGVQAGNGAALICFAASTYSVGGTAAGQAGPVTLQLGATNPTSTQQVVVAQAASSFTFPTRLPQGANWSISVVSAPAGQTCSVAPASGTAIAADVTNVALTCTTVTVDIAPPTLPDGSLDAPYSQPLSASSANGGTAPYAFGIVAGATPGGVTLSSSGVLSGTPTAAGTFNFTVQATSSNGFSGTRAYALVIAQGAQSITNFAASPAAPLYAPGGSFTVSATGGASGNPVVFGSSTPATCTVSGNTVTTVAAGTCTLTADQAGNANYAAAPQATLTVTIGRAPQAITGFTSNPASPTYAPGGTFTVSATGGASGNPVVFASTSPAVCTVSGSTVTMQSAGTCTLTADQAGNANYDPAPQATLSVAIGTASQTITFGAQAARTFVPGGTFAISPQATASSGLPVAYSSLTTGVCTVSGTTVTMVSAGSCVIAADQPGNANYAPAPQVTQAVAIGRAPQAITGFTSNPASPTYTPGGTFTVSATGGASGNPVVFASTSPAVCTVSGSTVTMQSAGTCTLTADQAGNANYDPAPQATLSVAIGTASQTITFGAQAARTFVPGGTFAISPQATASSGLPVAYSSLTTGVCTVSGTTVTMVSAGSCVIAADQPGNANYAPAPQVTQAVAIGRAPQAITGFTSNPASPTYAPGGTFTVSATGGASGNPVVFASTSPAVCTVSGSTVTMQSAGTCTLTADQAGTTSYDPAPQAVLNVAIGRATPVLAWIGNQSRVFGDPAFDLPNPSSTGPGAFTFTSSNAQVATVSGRTVTLTGSGTTTLTATQAASTNYAAGAISIILTVDSRPDPTRDAAVVGMLQAQVDASVRFAQVQQDNIRGRLSQLRGGGNASSNQLSLNVQGGIGQPGLALGASELGAMPATQPGWGLWTAGSVVLGEADRRGVGDGAEFRSDGVTFGIDRQLGGGFVLGAAGGFGWNDTDLDDGRSSLDARQRSFALYGLWRADAWFVDGILGIGTLDFDIARWSAISGRAASADREGDQRFGSLTAGYQFPVGGGALTGYGRLDASRTTLDAYREDGLGIYDLQYREQDIDSSTAAVGVEGRYGFQTASASVRPYWTVEWRQALDGGDQAAINYVVLPRANDYTLGLRSYNDDTLAIGAGLDLAFNNRWSLSFLLRREQARDVFANMVGFRISYGPPVRSTLGERAAGQEQRLEVATGAGGGTGTGP